MFKPLCFQTEIIETDSKELHNLLLGEKEIVFVIDKKVLNLNPSLLSGFADQRIIPVHATEEIKSFAHAQTLITQFHQLGVNRSTIVCGIGGGITTDIASFVASIYKRGTRLWLIPTTVIAMADAAIGGKTAVNFEGTKNEIGTFYPAEKVFYNPEFLQTLPYTEKHNGLFELLKISFIDDNVKLGRQIFTDGLSMKLILTSVHAKLKICINDLSDRGDRRKLNLGHTFGHLIESIYKYKIPHGFAVGLGLRIALRCSREYELINDETFTAIEKRLSQIPLTVFLDPETLSKIKEQGKEILLADKKNTDKLTLVLFKGLKPDIVVHSIDYSDRVLEIIIEELGKQC
ncbi:MAG: 3-dehydroquinate synthase [Candidatus Cloacimonetes bacterium]|nr:3-dehydroquinate synthase [Candidatus Cloacimonadota bacterium]